MSYTTLQADIASYMHRSDLTEIIPTWIALAEARINRDLRVPEMAVEATINTTDGVAPLPARYLDMRDISYNPGVRSLALVGVGRHGIANIRGKTGQPVAYSIVGSTIEIRPTADDTDFFLQFWQAPEPLATVEDTDLLDRYPYLYLYGALIEGGIYTKDQELRQTANEQYQSDGMRVNEEAELARFGESPTMTVA